MDTNNIKQKSIELLQSYAEKISISLNGEYSSTVKNYKIPVSEDDRNFLSHKSLENIHSILNKLRG